MNSIGERIKIQRKKLGLTQLQIKELTGISSGTLSDIENGNALPATKSLIKLSKVLNCSIDWMLTGNASGLNFSSDKREEVYINRFRSLSENDKNEILDIIELKLKRAKESEKNMRESSILTASGSDN